MNNLWQALWVELLKARRSRMPLLTALGFSFVPLAGGFFMIVLKDPEMARRVGLVSAKAQLTMGAADWPNYLRFLTLATGAGGSALFGLITAWVFGREYSDRTAKDLLALPTARASIVISKLLVVIVWSLAITLLASLVTLAVGAALRLPAVAAAVFFQTGLKILVAACLVLVLVTPFAFAASVWRGYLPPIGVLGLVMVLSQFINAAGYGEFFPWSVPALFVQDTPLGLASYLIVGLTGLAGLAATLLWWRSADQNR